MNGSQANWPTNSGMCIDLALMGDGVDLLRALSRGSPVGRIARAISLAGGLVAIPLGVSHAQTTDLAAQFGGAPDTSSVHDETNAFAAQFAGVIAPLEPNIADIDLALPNTAVDLGSFETPRDFENIVRDLGTGVASYYGRRFHGRRTANGERFDMHAMTAAHKTLPFGTRVLVTNPRNGRSVTVRINDRGPFIRGRTIDLSRAAAERIGMIASGHARVKLEIVAR